jgi:hypothetical protein
VRPIGVLPTTLQWNVTGRDRAAPAAVRRIVVQLTLSLRRLGWRRAARRRESRDVEAELATSSALLLIV